MKRLLIASDDAHTSALLARAFAGLDATIADKALEGLRRALVSGEADLVVVDAGRHPGDVVDEIDRALAEGAEARVLLLVEPDMLDALKLPVRAASDFVVRGASSNEIAARARTLLWPGEEATGQDIVRTDNLVLNLATYQASLNGEPIDFTYLEYALFAFLVTHPGRTYSRENLLSRVWGTDYYGGSRTVDVHIRRIRAKIGPELSHRLETVRNVGYLWNG